MYQWRVNYRDTWVAQSVEHPTLAQVMISQSVGSSPDSGSVLTAQSLQPASDSVSPSLYPSPTCLWCMLFLSKINKHYKKFFKKVIGRHVWALPPNEFQAEAGRIEDKGIDIELTILPETTAENLIWDLNSWTVRSWPEPKPDVQPTEPPRLPCFCFSNVEGPILMMVHPVNKTLPGTDRKSVV